MYLTVIYQNQCSQTYFSLVWIKLSDFGLAVTQGTYKGNIKLSGTLGYVAPEYLLDGRPPNFNYTIAYIVLNNYLIISFKCPLIAYNKYEKAYLSNY